jgi:hypothetical protein
MRILPVLAVLGSALGLAACINVERDPRPAPPTVVTPAPAVVAPQAPPPTVTVRPSY